MRICPHCGKSLALSEHQFTERQKQQFWKRVIKLDNGCWKWKTGNHSEVYGRFRVGKQTIVAHRAAYLLLRGPIEDGKVLMHTCDFPRCVNPDHLKIGTNAENMRDMVDKGRANRPTGSDNLSSKYTDRDVLQIKLMLRDGKPLKEIAAQFNVTLQSIYQIGRCWKWAHVAPELGQTIRQRLFEIPPERIAEIHRLKKEMGLSQSQIADRLGMWQATVSKILRRNQVPA